MRADRVAFGQMMRVQLWSYKYDPEPQGIGPLSRSVARGLHDIGHDVVVVAAHPHCPEAKWGKRVSPYREVRWTDRTTPAVVDRSLRT